MPIGRAALLSCRSRSSAVEVSPSCVVMAVVMIMAVARARGGLFVPVCARFGLEGGFQCGHVEAELAHQTIEHVIVQIEQPPKFDLQRDVAIAQVISGS